MIDAKSYDLSSPFLTRNRSTPTSDRLEAYPTLVSGLSSPM
jgi:hypothetical protein